MASIDGDADGVRLEIDAPATAPLLAIGDSVSVGGCCLTAVALDGGRVSFDAVPETLARTSLGRLAPGSRVNVEPALRAGEPLGGHYVQGHVDGVGAVRSAEPEGDGRRVWFDAPPTCSATSSRRARSRSTGRASPSPASTGAGSPSR